MIGLPQHTEVKKQLNKKNIYEKFKSRLTHEQQKLFDTEISRMIITNQLNARTLNVEDKGSISSAFVIKIILKKRSIDEKNLRLLSKYIGQNIIFVLCFESEEQLGIFRGEHYFATKWAAQGVFNLKLNGLNMGEVWDNITIQIANIDIKGERGLEEQIEIDKIKNKLINQIALLERKARNEKQPKKCFDLVQEINKLKKQLSEL